MPRTARASQGGDCYHGVNRGNGRRTVFHKDGDFHAFVKLLCDAGERFPTRLLAYCLMPNHFHFCRWPCEDGELSEYRMRLLTAHVRRYLLTVLRYIERNPVRANRVNRAQDCIWSSAAIFPESNIHPWPILSPGPVPRPAGWLDHVNEPQTEAEVERLRECLRRGRPFGSLPWMSQTAQRFGLEASLRPRGRPKKNSSLANPGLLEDDTESES